MFFVDILEGCMKKQSAISDQQLTERYFLIRNLFRARLKEWHPDVNRHPRAGEVTLMLIEKLKQLDAVYKRLGGTDVR